VKILLVYPGASWSPYDVATGYEAALRSLGHEVVTFDYHLEYGFFKRYLAWLCEHRGLTFPKDGAMIRASAQMVISCLDYNPDLILNVMGVALHRRAYIHAHLLGIPMALILTESPYMDDHQANIISKGFVRLVFTNDKTSVEPLHEATGVPAVYLPHSYDPARHYPHQVGEELQTDVFFYGTLWPGRKALLDSVDWGQYRAYVGGARFDPGNEAPKVIRNDGMALWYSGTRIALNHHRTIATDGGTVPDAYSLGPRAYEIAGCGAFQLCDDARPELAEVFGDSVATYSDGPDLRAKVDYYLAHDEERQEMAAEAHRRVQPCSFLHRAREILMPAIDEML